MWCNNAMCTEIKSTEKEVYAKLELDLRFIIYRRRVSKHLICFKRK